MKEFKTWFLNLALWTGFSRSQNVIQIYLSLNQICVNLFCIFFGN